MHGKEVSAYNDTHMLSVISSRSNEYIDRFAPTKCNANNFKKKEPT